MRGEGNGNPLQYSCLGNLTDGGAWRAIVHGVEKKKKKNEIVLYCFGIIFKLYY